MRVSRSLLPWLVCLAFAAAAPQSRGDELDAIRESVRTEPPAAPDSDRPRRPRKSHHETEDCDDEPGVFSQLIVAAALRVLASPWSVPLILTQDEYVERAVVVPEPYLNAPFALQFESQEEPVPQVFGRLQLDFSTNFDGLERVGGNLLIETPRRAGLDASWSNWWERDGSTTDTLQLGDANLVFRFAQSEDLQFRTGLGINWMADRADGDIGFNFTYGFDYYPRRPWVISSSIDWGTLGHASLFHNQTTVGYLFRRCEIFTGFENYRIGRGELSGWISGPRWRF